MPRAVRLLLIAACVAVVLVAVVAIALLFPPTRSAVLQLGLRAVVATKGYHLVGGQVTYAQQQLVIRDLTIDDDRGDEFFTARELVLGVDPKGLFGRSDRAFGLRSIDMVEPRLSLRHRADGSWNFTALLPPKRAAPPPAAPTPAPSQRWLTRLTIARGDIDVLDPQAVVQAGKRISLTGVESDVSVAQGGVSRGVLRATLQTDRGSAQAHAQFFEDDQLGFARATLSTPNVPIAPLVDVFVPTSAFVIEGGVAPLRLMAYAIGYPPGGAPQWHVAGDAAIEHARLRVTPLVVTIRDVHCTVHFNDGLLSMQLALGDAEGMPLRASGTVRLRGGIRLAVGITQSGTLERAKQLFAFSKHQDVSGPFATAVRIDGPPADIHVAGLLEANGARYQRLLLPDVRGAFYYVKQHLSIGALDLASGNARVWSQADLDMSRSPLTVHAILALIAPASDIPVAANVMPGGIARAIASVNGPALSPSGLGYAQLTGQPGVRVRTFVSGGPDVVALGPLLYEQGGGEGFLWARRDLQTRIWSGGLYATRLPVHVQGGPIALADFLGSPVSLPSLDTTFSGTVFLLPRQGNNNTQPVAVDVVATSFVYEGVRLGRVSLTAAGDMHNVRVGRLSVDGPGLTGSGAGTVALGPSFAPTSAVLSGTLHADLRTLAQAFPSIRLAGSGSGDFKVAYDGAHWMGAVNATSADASLAGVPIRGTSAIIEGSPGATALLADVRMPQGGVWAFGTLPSHANPNATLDAVVPSLDLAALGPLGLRSATGRATGFATISGSSDDPSIEAAAVLRGSYERVPYAGDVDMQYGGGTLRSSASRIALLGNQAIVSGAMSGLGFASAQNPRLALSVRVREGDLYALNRFTGKNAPVTGSYDADARIGGVLKEPTVDAQLDTDIGTIRGVAFNGLHGAVRIRPNELALTNGSVQLGTSAFALSANATPRTFSVRATSPHVDMTDFNDFFGGRDVFAGNGAFHVAVSSLQHRLFASGAASLEDAALYDYPLGRIQTTFGASRRGGLRAAVTQSGPGGSMDISGVVGFRSYRGNMPDFATAAYRVRGHLRDLQLDEVLPLVHQEDLGLSGLLDADGTMRGTLHQPVGNATFQLRNGYLKRIQIQNFSANVASDENGVTLNNGTLVLPFLTAQGSGRYGFSGRTIDGTVTLQNADLHALGKSLRIPGKLSGQASGRVTLAGSVAHPRAAADIDAANASIYDIAFDQAKLHAQYAPGEVSIGDTTLTFAGKHGEIDVTGALPVQLHPFALGPKERPVDFSLAARKVDLSVFDPITKQYAALTGRLDAQATVTGTAGNPVGKGSATIAGASVQSPLETVALTGANAQLAFENDTITLKHLHASLGSGSIDMRGAAHVVPAAGLRSYAGLQIWTRLGLHNAQLNVPNWISGTLDGAMSFTRSGTVPYVAGNVNVSNASIPFAAISALAEGGVMKAPPPGPIPGVPELKPGHTIVYGGGLWGPDLHTLTTIGQPTPAPTGLTLPSVDLDVGLNANNNVRIRGGSSVDLTTTGGIMVSGNLQAPTLQGQFQAIRGQVGYFDTTFRVVSATVTFDPTSGLLPTLNATAVTNVNGAQITLVVSGRVDNLNTDLQSNPSMSREQIIATLLHAPQVAALTSSNPAQASAVLSQTATAYFNAQLTRSLLYPLESALAQELNIESISLIFNQYGELAVEVRTNFSPTVSAVYQSSVSVPITQAYGMSYRLQDYLALDVLQTSRPDYAYYTTVFNLRYTFE